MQLPAGQKINLELLPDADLKKTENEIYKQSQLEPFPTEYYTFAGRERATGGFFKIGVLQI